jgi:hypothetical protein
MNEFDPSLDEIVSAYVDGVATPAERARVENDPTLVERAATFRRVQDALATAPAATDDELRNRFIARALAESAPPIASVQPLRSRRATTLGPIIAAAAVIAMFFGLGTWLVASQDNNDDSASTSAGAPSAAEDLFDAKSQPGSGAAATTTASSAGGSAAAPQSESAKGVPVYLGAFDNEPTLRQAVDSALAGSSLNTQSTSPPRTATTLSSCGRTDPPEARIFTADLRGRPVTIVVTGTRADVYDNATCVASTLDVASR